MSIEDLEPFEPGDNSYLDLAEEAAWNEQYKLYSDLRGCYEKLIKLEYDHHRKQLLASMLADLNEENK